jgi:hypothetical protein
MWYNKQFNYFRIIYFKKNEAKNGYLASSQTCLHAHAQSSQFDSDIGEPLEV